MPGMSKYLNKTFINQIFLEIFVISLIVYLILFLLEWISPGFVYFYFESNIILWTLIGSSLGYFITFKK